MSGDACLHNLGGPACGRCKMEVPTGWRLVDGPTRGGDKYWNAAEGKWYPITTNTFADAAAYVAVIRKGG